jgi:drug/metabolite transporter (DMT)-like permease
MFATTEPGGVAVQKRSGAAGGASPVVAYLQLALAMMLTGSYVVVGKLVVRSFPIFFAGGTTLGLAALFFVVLLLLKEGRFPRIGRRDLGLLALQAFIGLFLYRISILKGLEYTGGIEAGIILSTTPAVIGLISFTFLREKAHWNRVGAVILAIAGILFINLSGYSAAPVPGARPALGSLLLFVSVLGEAAFTVLRKMLSGSISALANAAGVSLLAFLMLLPFTLSQIQAVNTSQLDVLNWLELAYYGTVVPIAVFLLWFSGVGKAPVHIAGVFTGFISISALILSVLILGETAVWSHFVGLALVLAGIILAVGITRKKSRPA